MTTAPHQEECSWFLIDLVAFVRVPDSAETSYEFDQFTGTAAYFKGQRFTQFPVNCLRFSAVNVRTFLGTFSAISFVMAGKDAEDEKFLATLRQNQFLEREAAYHKTNQELEKKTADLIARLEQYSKSRSCVGSYYEGDDTASEFGTDDGLSACSEWPRSFTAKPSRLVNGACGDTDNSLKVHSSGSATAQRLSRLCQEINANGPDDDLVNMNPRFRKQKSRLQKATESVIKSLQAKLLNHEERLADLHLQNRQKIQENTMQESKIKALEEERERLLKVIANQQGVVEKHAKSAESSKSNLSLKSQTVSIMQKEIDDLKREKKQTSTTCTSYQSRLHRVGEENEKLRNLNKSLTLQLREIRAEHKLRLDEKQHKIQELEKHRNMLSSTITRQTQLIKQLRQLQQVNEITADKPHDENVDIPRPAPTVPN